VRFIQFKVTLKLQVGNQAGATEYATDVVACDARMKTEGAKVAPLYKIIFSVLSTTSGSTSSNSLIGMSS
jgi:hypothetical protein